MSVDVLYTGEIPPPARSGPESTLCVFRHDCPVAEPAESLMSAHYEVRCPKCDTVFRSRTQGTAVIQ